MPGRLQHTKDLSRLRECRRPRVTCYIQQRSGARQPRGHAHLSGTEIFFSRDWSARFYHNSRRRDLGTGTVIAGAPQLVRTYRATERTDGSTWNLLGHDLISRSLVLALVVKKRRDRRSAESGSRVEGREISLVSNRR